MCGVGRLSLGVRAGGAMSGLARWMWLAMSVVGCDGAAGPMGAPGLRGQLGEIGDVGDEGDKGDKGDSCWDVNQNGVCDPITEDDNGDGICDLLDCDGPAGAVFWAGDDAAIGYAGRVSVGAAVGNAALSVSGTVSMELTGLVTTVAGNVTVTGSGTLFLMELNVGDSIGVDGEVFTVATIASETSLALDAAPAAGVSDSMAFTDGQLFSVSSGAGAARLTVDKSGAVGIGTVTPLARLQVVGEVRTTDGADGPRLWGQGRPSAVRYGVVGVEAGLCVGGGVFFGLSSVMLSWGGAAAACPAGTWVCTSAERGSGVCDTARPDDTEDHDACDGSAVDLPANDHQGWVADAGGADVRRGLGRGELGIELAASTCVSQPVWCCSE